MMNGIVDVLIINIIAIAIGGVLVLMYKALERYFGNVFQLNFYYRFLCAVLLLYGVSFVIGLFRICYHIIVHPNATLFGMATSAICWISALLMIAWLIGMIVQYKEQKNGLDVLHGIYHNRMPAPLCYKNVLDEVREEMGIRRHISLYQSYQARTVFISGIIKPTIYLPVEKLEDSSLRVIFMHELQHYKQGDITFKFISAIMSIVYWFWLPYFYIIKKYNLYAEANNDNYCLKMLKDARKYYHILLDFADLSNMDTAIFVPALIEEKDEIIRRATLVNRYKANKTKLSWAALFIAFVLVTCSVTAYGATSAIQYGYNQTWNATMMGEQEELIPVPELEEYEGTIKDLEGLTVVEEDEQAITARTGETTISTSLMNQCYYRSKVFTKSAGGTVRVNVDVTPTNKEVTVGIIKPDRTTTYVKGKGTIAHTFSTPTTGTYQVFISNYSGTKVSIYGYYK